MRHPPYDDLTSASSSFSYGSTLLVTAQNTGHFCVSVRYPAICLHSVSPWMISNIGSSPSCALSPCLLQLLRTLGCQKIIIPATHHHLRASHCETYQKWYIMRRWILYIYVWHHASQSIVSRICTWSVIFARCQSYRASYCSIPGLGDDGYSSAQCGSRDGMVSEDTVDDYEDEGFEGRGGEGRWCALLSSNSGVPVSL